MAKRQIMIRQFSIIYRDDEEKVFNQRFFQDVLKIRDKICECDDNFNEVKFNEHFNAIFKNLDEALFAKSKAIEIMSSIEDDLRL